MSFTWIIACGLIFILIKQAMETRAKERSEKLRILEASLKQGDLDPATKEELMDVLTGHKRKKPAPPVHPPQRVGFFMRAFAFLGWVALCLGGAFLIIDPVMDSRAFGYPKNPGQ